MADASITARTNATTSASPATRPGEASLLKSTTRHVRLFTARVENGDLVPDLSQLTLDVDPDNEFLWDEAVLTKVQQRFTELVQARAGEPLNDYTLRRIGSELEGLIRQLLQAGELRYNPDCRVLNYSMGLPRTPESL
jgi:NAD(P)H-quinone oxidoreductase subunit M